MAKSKDLFDDTTMTFGEHLEALRSHLIKALLGLVVAVIVMLYYSDHVLALIRYPIDVAMQKYGVMGQARAELDALEADDRGFAQRLRDWWSGAPDAAKDPSKDPIPDGEGGPESPADEIELTIRAADLAGALHGLDAERYPAPDGAEDRTVRLVAKAPEFADLRKVVEEEDKPITLTVQEAFTTYLKVAFASGLVVAGPWVFYQMWLFVAAGLYPHERKYVHVFLPISIGLFLGGAIFCFLVVFPFMLEFLLSFNVWLGVKPEIRLSEWINFALLLPLIFGLSFQLPLIMLFLERIGIFEVEDYRNRRRMAVLVIAIASMMITPGGDPMSMIAMMIPLVILYELGIWMCRMSVRKSPFEAEAT